uniref:G_PROTEIN_RECEP_F1_2 domain-containing protein n=1 Tax=Heterorhabditis bacteriophora TaxID=37862 RepID=A0A1I7XEY3_HETBA
MYLLFSLTVCVIPTVTSLAVALYILKVVSSHQKKLAEEQALYNNSSTTHSHAIASRLRTFYFIFMTTVFTAATLLPYRISAIVLSFGEQKLSTCSGTLSRWLMSYLISLNAILNPLITVTVLPQYRCKLVSKFLGTSGSETKATDL